MFASLYPPLARRLLLAGCLALTLPGLTRAQDEAAPPDQPAPHTLVDPGFAALAWLIQNDPDGALDRISAMLDGMEQRGGAEPRVIFDLYSIAADLMIEGGSADQAAQILARLAGFAAQYREMVGIDPLPVFAEAAALLEDTGQLAAARDTLVAMVEEQRGGVPPEAEIAATIEALARVSAALGQPVPDLPQAERTGGEGGFRAVEVYYATDRARTGSPRAAEFYGGGRGTLELGVATVTIPETPVPDVAPPPRVWQLEFRDSPARHAVLQAVTPLDPGDYYDRLRADVSAHPAPEALVYIHGYDTRFEQAARRAAQIAYNMAYEGVPILYSWPSRGSSIGYVSDTAAVRLSARRLSGFLEDLAARSGAATIHLLAEGMGNRALTDALELLAAQSGQGPAPVFGQVVFAVPDVDAGLFQQMLPAIRPLARRLTLYASDRDWGLGVADMLYGDALRAGLGGDVTLTDPALDSIDLSDPEADGPDQGVFAGPGAALADLAALLWRDADPARRCGLRPAPGGEGDQPVWRQDGAACDGPELLAVLAHLRHDGVQGGDAADALLQRIVPDPVLRQRLEPAVRTLFEQ